MEVNYASYEDLEEQKDIRESFMRVKAEVNAKKYMHEEDYEVFDGIDFDNTVPKNLSQDQLQQLLLEKHQELIALGLVDEQPAYYVTNRSEVRIFDRSIKTCSRFGVYPGSRVQSPKGPGWVVGAFDGYIWFHLEVDYGATYWNNGIDFDAIVNKVGITPLNYSQDFDKALASKHKLLQPTNPDLDIEDTISHHQRRMERDSDGEAEHAHQHKHQKHQQHHPLHPQIDSDVDADETETESDKEAGKTRGNPYPFQAPGAWQQVAEQKIPVPYEEAPIGMITEPKIIRKILEYAAPRQPNSYGVFSHVYSLDRLLKLGRVCKKWYEYCSDDILWAKALQLEFSTLPEGEWSIKSFRPKEWLQIRYETLKWLVVLFSRFVGTAYEGLTTHSLETVFQEVFQRQPLCDELGILFVELHEYFEALLEMDLQEAPELFTKSLDVLKRMDDLSTQYEVDIAIAVYVFTCFLKFFHQLICQTWEKSAPNPYAAISVDEIQQKYIPNMIEIKQKNFYNRVTIFSFQQLRENLELLSGLCRNCAYYLQEFNDAPLEFKCDGCRETPRFLVFIKILKTHGASFQDHHVRCHYVYFECEKCLPAFFRTTVQPHRTTMMSEYMELMEDADLRKVLKESMAAQREQATPSQQEVLTESGEDYVQGNLRGSSQFIESYDDWE